MLLQKSSQSQIYTSINRLLNILSVVYLCVWNAFLFTRLCPHMLCRHCKFNLPNPSLLLKRDRLKHWHHSARRTLHFIYTEKTQQQTTVHLMFKAHRSRTHTVYSQQDFKTVLSSGSGLFVFTQLMK